MALGLPAGAVGARRWLLDGLGCFAAYYGLAWLSFIFIFPDVRVAAWWLPSGLTIVLLTRTERSRWPALVLGICAAEAATLYSWHYPAPLWFRWAIADAIEPVIGALILQYFAGRRIALVSAPEVFALVAAALVSTSATGLLSAAFAENHLPGSNFWSVFGAWFVGNCAAILTLGALLFTWTGDWLTVQKKRGKIIEGCFLFGSLAFISLAVFGEFAELPHLSNFPFFLFPFGIWAAFRFGPRGAAIAHMMTTAIATICTARGYGPFATPTLSPTERVATVEIFLFVNTVTLVLAATYQSMQDALNARLRFIALAAHELRTPITPLALAIQSLKSRLPENSSPAITNRVELAERQVSRLSRLVDALLDTTRFSRGQIALERAVVNLTALVHEVCNDLTPQASSAGSLIQIQAAPARLMADRLRLEQIVTNLVTNAIKYSQGSPIRVVVHQDKQSTFLEVSDHGPGIPRNQQAQIFECFTRLNSEAHVPGLGLGLYLTRMLVNAHGGQIRVHSNVGQGSTFIVQLPNHWPDEPSPFSFPEQSAES